jgi:hypothetical protein
MMPGMAANPTVFERIDLPDKEFKMVWLSWIIPEKKESLKAYARRMVEPIEKDKPVVLIGVSFGGILVQEMSRFLMIKRLIIISSVKTNHELPARMKVARYTGVYRILPIGLLNYLAQIEKLPIGSTIRKRLKLYQQYLSINDKYYINWAIKEMICWEQDQPIYNIVHIHGVEDLVFPIKNISDCIRISKGTHIMILNKYRWFNSNLPRLISEGMLQHQKIN